MGLIFRFAGQYNFGSCNLDWIRTGFRNRSLSVMDSTQLDPTHLFSSFLYPSNATGLTPNVSYLPNGKRCDSMYCSCEGLPKVCKAEMYKASEHCGCLHGTFSICFEGLHANVITHVLCKKIEKRKEKKRKGGLCILFMWELRAWD